MAQQSSFDEISYLKENNDVAIAVSQGHFLSGEQHYIAHGRREGRRLHAGARPSPSSLNNTEGLLISRRDKLLAGIDPLLSSGVEIGALDKPMVTKGEGDIFYVDFATADQSREKYINEPSVNNYSIVDVDGLWGDSSLEQCVRGRKFDYVVASHVVEHVPDLITWLKEISSILKPGGELRLIVPDRRYTFDVLRPESQPFDILASYVERRRRPPARTIIEYHTLSSLVDSRAIWDGQVPEHGFEQASSTSHGVSMAEDAEANAHYHDTHCWVFTPSSFVLALLNLAELNLVDFSCTRLIDTERYEIEFIVHMQQSSDLTYLTQTWRHQAELLRK